MYGLRMQNARAAHIIAVEVRVRNRRLVCLADADATPEKRKREGPTASIFGSVLSDRGTHGRNVNVRGGIIFLASDVLG